jgi:hypothetical protein
MNELLEALGSSAIGDFMAVNPIAFPTVETLHVMAITAVLGVIAIVDLRLVGLAGTSYAITRMAKTLLPVTWIAFGLAVITGALLFSSQPLTYAGNFSFRMKLVLIAAAGLNMLVFHFVTMRGIAAWDRDAPVPLAGRLAGGLSILIWLLVVAFGRWIGFTMSPF